MRVDTKEVVRRQLRALGNDRFELGIQRRDTGAMELGMLRAENIINSVGFLKWKNQSGHFIRIGKLRDLDRSCDPDGHPRADWLGAARLGVFFCEGRHAGGQRDPGLVAQCTSGFLDRVRRLARNVVYSALRERTGRSAHAGRDVS